MKSSVLLKIITKSARVLSAFIPARLCQLYPSSPHAGYWQLNNFALESEISSILSVAAPLQVLILDIKPVCVQMKEVRARCGRLAYYFSSHIRIVVLRMADQRARAFSCRCWFSAAREVNGFIYIPNRHRAFLNQLFFFPPKAISLTFCLLIFIRGLKFGST